MTPTPYQEARERRAVAAKLRLLSLIHSVQAAETTVISEDEALAMMGVKRLLAGPEGEREAVGLSASDHACYLFPGKDQAMLRDAFVQGALCASPTRSNPNDL